MADNKNMELNDEMMAKASGGTSEPTSDHLFNVGDRVYIKGKEEIGTLTIISYYWAGRWWMYNVRWDDGDESLYAENGLHY